MAAQPPDRRAVLAAVRQLVRRHLPRGYEEAMSGSMITWQVPLARYPKTYNGQPLAYLSLAAQKNYYALYLMGAYADPAQAEGLARAYAKAGKKLDLGKSCLRFKALDDLERTALAKVVAATPPEAFIARYEASRRK